MRAYDKAKYEVPMKKIKKNSGFTFNNFRVCSFTN